MVNTRAPKVPLHDLDRVRVAAASEDTFAISPVARRDAENLGYDVEDVREVVQRLSPGDFDEVWVKRDKQGRLVLTSDGEQIRMDVYLPFATNRSNQTDQIYLKLIITDGAVTVVSVQSFHLPRKPV